MYFRQTQLAFITLQTQTRAHKPNETLFNFSYIFLLPPYPSIYLSFSLSIYLSLPLSLTRRRHVHDPVISFSLACADPSNHFTLC